MANQEQIIEAVKNMTVLELNELVKACEEEFGVSAAAPVAVAGAVAARTDCQREASGHGRRRPADRRGVQPVVDCREHQHQLPGGTQARPVD